VSLPIGAPTDATIPIKNDDAIPSAVVSVNLDIPQQLEGNLSDPNKIDTILDNLDNGVASPKMSHHQKCRTTNYVAPPTMSHHQLCRQCL
jgi:hypothetical protein